MQSENTSTGQPKTHNKTDVVDTADTGIDTISGKGRHLFIPAGSTVGFTDKILTWKYCSKSGKIDNYQQAHSINGVSVARFQSMYDIRGR